MLQTRRPQSSLRLVHISDVHLGDNHAGLGRKALSAVVDTTLALHADGLLIAGDLFESNRVPDAEVEAFLAEAERLGRPVVVLPGNHDCYVESSIYRRPSFQKAPPNLHLLSQPEGHTLVIPELGLEVWGRPVVDHYPGFRPLQNVPPRQNGGWYVAMAHGHFTEAGDFIARSSPILPEDIAAAPCDYVALGHWDGMHDKSQGGVPAYYSGAPRIRWDADTPGHVMHVEFGPQTGVRVSPVPLV